MNNQICSSVLIYCPILLKNFLFISSKHALHFCCSAIPVTDMGVCILKHTPSALYSMMDGNVCRNFDYHWSEPGASYDSCSDSYYGPQAFSEVGVFLPVYPIRQLFRFLLQYSGILRGRDSSTRVSYNTAVQIPTMDPRYSQR